MTPTGDSSLGVGTSLWLMPEGLTLVRLAAWIDRLAARLGTPTFPPHVTLLSGLDAPEREVLAVCAEHSASLSPLTIRLDGVEGMDARFRCLYARAEPDDALRAAHVRAARWFGREPDPSFDPHLSLVYGTLAPDVKADLVRELWEPTRLLIGVRRLHVWRTDGEVGAWTEIGAFDLGGPGL